MQHIALFNRILAIHGWDVDAAMPDHELAAIAREIADTTGVELLACVAFVAALQATVIAAASAS